MPIRKQGSISTQKKRVAADYIASSSHSNNPGRPCEHDACLGPLLPLSSVFSVFLIVVPHPQRPSTKQAQSVHQSSAVERPERSTHTIAARLGPLSHPGRLLVTLGASARFPQSVTHQPSLRSATHSAYQSPARLPPQPDPSSPTGTLRFRHEPTIPKSYLYSCGFLFFFFLPFSRSLRASLGFSRTSKKVLVFQQP